MTLIEVLLILIGVGVLIFSCFFVDKAGIEGDLLNQTDGYNWKRNLTIEEITDIKNKINAVVSESVEETVDKTEDYLNKLSNEKIIAVDDFSSQVIEKISQNHEEVVFLYNMLNEKENELKNLMQQVDNTVRQYRETNLNHLAPDKSKEKHKVSKKDLSKNTLPNSNPIKPPANGLSENTNSLDSNNNNNDKILELHYQGKTVMEIARILGLGQGEVKLVINLFKDR